MDFGICLLSANYCGLLCSPMISDWLYIQRDPQRHKQTSNDDESVVESPP